MTLKKAPFLLLALALSTPLALLARGDGDAVAVAPNADQSNTSVNGAAQDSRLACAAQKPSRSSSASR